MVNNNFSNEQDIFYLEKIILPQKVSIEGLPTLGTEIYILEVNKKYVDSKMAPGRYKSFFCIQIACRLDFLCLSYYLFDFRFLQKILRKKCYAVWNVRA